MKNIYNFLKKQHIMTLCASLDNIPYCATCFYAFDEDKKILIFASDEETTHIKILKKNPYASGTINFDTKNVSKIEGVQFQGRFIKRVSEEIYYKKFPFAKSFSPKLWGIELEFIKYTNNRFGFGKKRVIGETYFENI